MFLRTEADLLVSVIKKSRVLPIASLDPTLIDVTNPANRIARMTTRPDRWNESPKKDPVRNSGGHLSGFIG